MKDKEYKEFKFVQNRKCEFFPCHEGADEETFNCLFCYCPLYALGSGCKGNFVFTEEGIKDCSKCMIPHGKNGYEYVTSKYDLIKEMVKDNEQR